MNGWNPQWLTICRIGPQKIEKERLNHASNLSGQRPGTSFDDEYLH
jgi:hypothetical protein